MASSASYTTSIAADEPFIIVGGGLGTCQKFMLARYRFNSSQLG
jgi:hypothetical protein